MLEALKPFASNAEGRELWDDDALIGGTSFPPLTNGHLREALAAIAAGSEE